MRDGDVRTIGRIPGSPVTYESVVYGKDVLESKKVFDKKQRPHPWTLRGPKRLRFSVISNPVPMVEMTPYEGVHPQHLDGFLVSKAGEFR